MKKFRKFISVLLVLITVFTATASSAAVPTYAQEPAAETNVVGSEKPVLTTAQFLRMIHPISTVLRDLFGMEIIPETNFEIEFKEGVALDLCNYICENSGLDIVSLFKSLRLDTRALEFVYELTDADTTAIRDQIYALRFKCDESGNVAMSNLLFFLGNYLSVINKVEVYTVPVKPEVTRVAIRLLRMDGTDEEILTDLYFNSEGLAYGKNNGGILGLGFECSVYDLLIYATVNCWMKDFGFCFFYDAFCYLTPFFNYVTRRFKFEYGGKEWMVQVWKGNYLIANGAEVGVYNREKGSIGTYYDCYDGLMNMTLKLSCGDNVIYDISGEHWWLNGFKLGNTLYKPKSLTMEFSIELPDEEMAQALADSINSHYRHDTSCVREGSIVKAVW